MPSPDESGLYALGERFLVDGLRDQRFDHAAIAPDSWMEDPLSGGKISGRDAMLDYALAHQSWLHDILIDDAVAQGANLSLIGALVTRNGQRISFSAWFTVHDGLIQSARLFWDPRSLLR